MKPVTPLKGGEEHDAFSRRWRRMLHWNHGRLRRVKERFWRRARRAARRELKGGAE